MTSDTIISSYLFEIESHENIRLTSSDGYRIYSWLLENMPEECANYLHSDGDKPITSFLYYEKETGKYYWRISLLTYDLNSIIGPVLDSLKEIHLHPEVLSVKLVEIRKIDDIKKFMIEAKENPIKKTVRLYLRTPCSFKQLGSYIIFPQEQLIIHSLINKWNMSFPEFSLEDEDARKMLEGGLKIKDYSLRTTRFYLKGIEIPCFIGSISIQSRLPLPLYEIWNLLVKYSEFCGIGIKTALGMGGVSIE